MVLYSRWFNFDSGDLLRHRNRAEITVLMIGWTEALSGMVFVLAQKLSGIAWT